MSIQGTKSVLEYTKEELEKLPVEQLKILLDEAKTGERQYWTEQTGLKLIINSLYGAMANRYFPLFNEKMAQAITGNGRFFIRLLSKNIENKLQSMLKSDNPYVTYNDTDSCVGSTLVKTSRGDIEIEKLFDLNGKIEVRGKDNYINHLDEAIDGLSVSDNLIPEYKKIKYVMKHKVEKRLYKIKVNGSEVIITQDHSIMILRNGELLEVKPGEIIKGDKVVMIK